MICFRPFRNSDPPLLVEIWRRQPPLRGLMQPMSTLVFEQLVLSKPYFDRQGLILAECDDKPIAFVHAAFGPNESKSDVSTETGITCMLLVLPTAESDSLRADLLDQSEAYLRHRGAQRLLGGGILPNAPFYLGLYGGSELPGVLTSDPVTVRMYRQHGYLPAGECSILKRDLSGFRPPMDRGHLLLRRQYQVEADTSYLCQTWWEACILGQSDQTCFRMKERSSGTCHGTAVLWDMEPMASGWGVHAMGVIHLHIDAAQRGRGLGTFLVSEAMRQVLANGALRVQTQISTDNSAAAGLFHKLGFREVDRGLLFAKR